MYCSNCGYRFEEYDSEVCRLCGSTKKTEKPERARPPQKKKSPAKAGVRIGIVLGAVFLAILFFGQGTLDYLQTNSLIPFGSSKETSQTSEVSTSNTLDTAPQIEQEEPRPKKDLDSPIIEDTTSSPTNYELEKYALSLVNEDRQKHGADPVVLGTSRSAQAHAEDMLRNGYHSHWNSDGVKPYVTYTQLGGKHYVAENLSTTFLRCPSENCGPHTFVPKEEIERHQHKMMYDDAEADWGHRDTIINPEHTHVNFGFTYDEKNFYFVQHFETKIIQWDYLELEPGSILRMEGSIPDDYSIANIAVYLDPNPRTLTGHELLNEPPYNNNYYDHGTLDGLLAPKLGLGTQYKECLEGSMLITKENGQDACVSYEIYNDETSDDSRFDITADVSRWLQEPGFHTVGIYLKSPKGELVLASSVTLEYL